MIEAVDVELAADWRASRRRLRHYYYGHGDFAIIYWHGDEMPSRAEFVRKFNLAHSAGLTVLATCIGFQNRIGVQRDDIAGYLRGVWGRTFGDPLTELPVEYFPQIGIGDAFRDADGHELKRYGNEALGWKALTPVIVAAPGLAREKGGTQFLSRVDDEHGDLMVLDRVNGILDGDTDKKHFAEFSLEDVRALGGLMCAVSLGEYRKEMREFISFYVGRIERGTSLVDLFDGMQ